MNNELVKKNKYECEKEEFLFLRAQDKSRKYTRLGNIINEFTIDTDTNNDELKAKFMVSAYKKYYLKERQGLKGMFTLNEANVIVDTFDSYVHTLDCNDKEVLEVNVKDCIEYEQLDKVYDVDADSILEKISELGEFQSFIVIRMAIEFWNKVESRISDEKLLQEIFGIV